MQPIGDNDLRLRIAEHLTRHTHVDLPRFAADAGFSVAPFEEGVSKKNRVMAALDGLDRRGLASVASRLGSQSKDLVLEETGLAILEEGHTPLGEITRRDIAKCFGYEFVGSRSTEKFLSDLRELFFIDNASVFPIRVERSLADEIVQNLIRNKGDNDFDTEMLFERLGALTCSRYRFAKLLEGALHPLTRRGPDQAQLVDEINTVLQRAGGYYLEITRYDDGYPVYELTVRHRGVGVSPKNLIFASRKGKCKPDLGFSDAVSNDVVIISEGDDSLHYERPTRVETGVLWSDLVTWWAERSTDCEDDAVAARTLYRRLKESLDSNAEHSLFHLYFFHFKAMEALPALVPQVFLHYDPLYEREQSRRQKRFSRERMDFLLLLANGVRIVIEVDGVRHFSTEDGEPSLPLYANMVSADRDLKLRGYDVYRFGSNELGNRRAASPLVKDFFEKLFRRYHLL